MKFDILKYAYGQELDGTGDPIDNRQRINLSDYAISIIEHDMDVFRASADITDSNQDRSKYINQILRNYKDISSASSAQLINLKREKYLNALAGLTDSETAAQRLLVDYKQELADKRTYFLGKRGTSVNIRLNKESLEYLVSPEAQANSHFYKDLRIGEFLKVLVEEFTELPYVIRERIFYKDIVDTVHAAVNDRKMIKIVLRSFIKNADGSLVRNSVYLKPFDILEDSGKQYNYIVGYSSKNVQGPWAPYPVRLSSVSQCKKLNYSGTITSKDRKELVDLIDDLGVAYIGSPKFMREKIVVQLTQDGEKLYRQILHQRPMFIKEEEGKHGPNTHCFYCSEFQARVYFFRFGKEARILSPVHLAQKFKALFEEAAARYQE